MVVPVCKVGLAYLVPLSLIPKKGKGWWPYPLPYLRISSDFQSAKTALTPIPYLCPKHKKQRERSRDPNKGKDGKDTDPKKRRFDNQRTVLQLKAVKLSFLKELLNNRAGFKVVLVAF